MVSHMLYQHLARGKVYCVLPMSIYFKAFHFPLRKEVTDTEIGQKQQVILSYILKKKKKKAITMSTSLSPKKGQKKELAVLLSIAIDDNGSQTVSIMLKKSNN